MTIKEVTRFFMDPEHRSIYDDWEDLINKRITTDPNLTDQLISANMLWVNYDLEITKEFLDQSFKCYAVGWTPKSAINSTNEYFRNAYRHQSDIQNLSELAYVRQHLNPQQLEMLEFNEGGYRPQYALVDRIRPQMRLKTELSWLS